MRQQRVARASGSFDGEPILPRSARSRRFAARALRSFLSLAPCGLAGPVQAQPGLTPPAQARIPSPESAIAAPPGVSAPFSSRVCEYGRVLAAGHCCWPGQDWEEASGRCVGQVAWCAPGMAADPAGGTGCLRVCGGGSLEMAPGRCCEKGQAWDASSNRCAVAVPQCPQGMVVTRSHICRAANAACMTDEQCNADSVCRNGSCARHTSRWRLEALADVALGFSGYWKGSTREWFGTDAGWGFTTRVLKGLSLRWDWGLYVGYLSISGTTDFFDQMDSTTRYAIVGQMLRGGGLLRIVAVTGPKVRMGFTSEVGFIVVRRGAPGGLEGAVDFFVDVPAIAGRHRLTATVAVGLRGGVILRDEPPNLYGYRYGSETWWFSPMLRIGLAFGH